MDVMRFAIDLALLIWAAWATWAYIRWKEISDDLRDALLASDEALSGARGDWASLEHKFSDVCSQLTFSESECRQLRDEIATLKKKEKPMPCKGKKTGKGKRGK